MAASYPASPKTFTVKTSAQKVASAHINDLQYEVEALESGLLTGTAPVNAGNSTFTGLSVTGGSTLRDLMPAADSTYALGSSSKRWMIHGSQLSTGTVPVAALASTAGTASTATFYRGDGEWATPVLRPLAACLVSLSTAVAVPKNTVTGLDWLTEEDNRKGMHSTTANSSRVTFADSTGLYQVSVNIQMSTLANTSTRICWCAIYQNDTTVVAKGIHRGYTEEPANDFSVTGLVRAQSTTDYVTVRVYQNSDTAASILSTSGAKYFGAFQVND